MTEAVIRTFGLPPEVADELREVALDVNLFVSDQAFDRLAARLGLEVRRHDGSEATDGPFRAMTWVVADGLTYNLYTGVPAPSVDVHLRAEAA